MTDSKCSRCGATLINEDCPNYGSGATHAPLLIEDEHGDVLYTGDLDAGKALARADRWVVEKPGASGWYVVELHDSPDLDSMAEWGAGETPDEAWRYALGAMFGPLDAEYDEDVLLDALVAAMPEPGATASTTYTVRVTVANRRGEVSLQWYRGTSLPEAMAAMAQAAVQDVTDTDMPESVRTYLRSVTLEVD